MPDDQSRIPTTPLTPHDAEEEITEKEVVGAFVAGQTTRAGRWQPPAPEDLQRDLPQFEIHTMLGRGGMGAVYKAWQRRLERFVAIKILPPGAYADDAAFAERFKREARAMARLQHPGIVAVHDAGETPGGLLYFVMECIEGTDLQQLVAARGKLDPAEALRITSAVCAALAYAHDHEVVHRDIKPSNIMIAADGAVKVADFGIAKTPKSDTTVLTQEGTTVGTLDFMAPEAKEAGGKVDHRADIFAVGVMLYQMLTGRIPHGKYERASRLAQGVDRRLDRIIDRALQPEREKRYASAEEMAAGVAKAARGVGAGSGASAGAGKRKALLALTAAALVGGIASTVRFAPREKGRLVQTPASTPAPDPGKPEPAVTPASAGKDAPFVNTLGMKFVPVPGTKALFCIWETRVQDYAVFAREGGRLKDDSWKLEEKDGVPVGREPDHPACAMTWDEADAFCQWLTKRETDAGKLPKDLAYRLPTDEEWDRAVGIPTDTSATPAERNGKNNDDFPWGTDFPPTRPVGNYGDKSFHDQLPAAGEKWLEGYSDGFPTTAPVGTFPPNALGIYDLGGNVWEWCSDFFDAAHTAHVLRGGSWDNSERGIMLAGHRSQRKTANRDNNHGFRCVLGPAAKN